MDRPARAAKRGVLFVIPNKNSPPVSTESLTAGNLLRGSISCSPPLGIIGDVEVKCSQTEDCTAMLQHHRNSPHFSVSFSRTRTEQLRDKLYRKIKECLPCGVSSFFQKGQLAITAADPVAARNGAAAAAVYPAWRHVEVGADGLHMDSCINLDCVTSFTDEVLGAQQQQQQQQRFQPQYMSRNAPPPQQHQQQYQPPRSQQYQTYHPQQPSQQQQQQQQQPQQQQQQQHTQQQQQQQHTQPRHTQQNSKQQQQQTKTHHPQQPPQQQVQAYPMPPPPAYPSQPTSPRYNEVTMENVAAPVRTRGSSPSGDTPGAKQRNITSKEGVNGAKH